MTTGRPRGRTSGSRQGLPGEIFSLGRGQRLAEPEARCRRRASRRCPTGLLQQPGKELAAWRYPTGGPRRETDRGHSFRTPNPHARGQAPQIARPRSPGHLRHGTEPTIRTARKALFRSTNLLSCCRTTRRRVRNAGRAPVRPASRLYPSDLLAGEFGTRDERQCSTQVGGGHPALLSQASSERGTSARRQSRRCSRRLRGSQASSERGTSASSRRAASFRTSIPPPRRRVRNAGRAPVAPGHHDHGVAALAGEFGTRDERQSSRPSACTNSSHCGLAGEFGTRDERQPIGALLQERRP